MIETHGWIKLRTPREVHATEDSSEAIDKIDTMIGIKIKKYGRPLINTAKNMQSRMHCYRSICKHINNVSGILHISLLRNQKASDLFQLLA